MKKALILSALLAVVTAVCTAQQPSESVSKFAFELYKNVAGDRSDNIVFAPFSLTPAFGMVALGARGETEQQMSQVFHFPAGQPAFHAELGTLQEKIRKGAGSAVDISITNRVWMEKTFRVNRQYKKSLRKHYCAKVALTRFTAQPEQSRVSINRAVEQDTRGHIKDLLPQGSITGLTRLVLTNAIYFKGKWEKEFDPQRTSQREFTLSSGQTVSCATMFVEDSMRHFVGKNHSAVELNYRGGSIAMLVLLPNEKVGMADFEKGLNIDTYNQTLAGLERAKVAVLLPKFKIETGLPLKKTLGQMGMPLAFSDAADLSGISSNNDLKISEAYHKAFIEVSEEGTTAAAATAVVVAMKSVLNKTEFIVNRPFIYILKDNRSNTILFMGKVENPNG